MKAKITFLTGPARGQSYAVSDSHLRLGRGSQCELRIRDEEISGLHLQLGRSADGGYFIEDLDSTNGTLLNGSKLIANKERPLQFGDQVSLGMSTFLFHDAETAPPEMTDLLDRTSAIPEGEESQNQTRPKMPLPPAKKPGLATPAATLGNQTIAPHLHPQLGRNHSQITNLTEYEVGGHADFDGELTLIGSQSPARGSLSSAPAGSVRRAAVSTQGKMLLTGGIAIVALLLLFTIMQSKPETVELDSGPFECNTTDFSATRPRFWKASVDSRSVFMHSAEQTQAVLISAKRNNNFYFMPLWNSPVMLKDFLQNHGFLDAGVVQQLGVSGVLPLSNLELLDWAGGIKAISFEMRQERGNALYGQLAFSHNLAIVFLARYPAAASQKCPPRLINLAAWIKLTPPLNSSLYNRPALQFPPLDRQERYQQACQELEGISSLLDKADDQSKYAEAINYYQLAFHKLAATGIEPAESEQLEGHVRNFLDALEKRRQYLRRLQSIILGEEAKGNKSAAIKEAENLYSEAKLTREHQFMEWAWKKLAEWKNQGGKQSSGFL
jgi:pSer/pThr/pTyr-binding forkhead associated (FHA) protein